MMKISLPKAKTYPKIKVKKTSLKTPKFESPAPTYKVDGEAGLSLPSNTAQLVIYLTSKSPATGRKKAYTIILSKNSRNEYKIFGISGPQGKLSVIYSRSTVKPANSFEEALKTVVSMVNKKTRKVKGSYKEVQVLTNNLSLEETYYKLRELEPCQVPAAKISLDPKATKPAEEDSNRWEVIQA